MSLLRKWWQKFWFCAHFILNITDMKWCLVDFWIKFVKLYLRFSCIESKSEQLHINRCSCIISHHKMMMMICFQSGCLILLQQLSEFYSPSCHQPMWYQTPSNVYIVTHKPSLSLKMSSKCVTERIISIWLNKSKKYLANGDNIILLISDLKKWFFYEICICYTEELSVKCFKLLVGIAFIYTT